MADRAFHDASKTQGVGHVTYSFSVAASTTVTNAATFVEGDTNAASAGAYIVSTKVATGKYRFKTKDPFLANVSVKAQLAMATPDGNTYHQIKKPSQNSDNTWQFEVWVWTNSAGTFSLADMTAADQIQVDWVLRNSTSLP